MIELIIYFADGSVYWKEYFKSKVDCDRWLAEEQTRPYWKANFTIQVNDLTPPPPSDAEKAAVAAKIKAISDTKATLKSLAGQNSLSASDLNNGLLNLLKLKALQGEI